MDSKTVAPSRLHFLLIIFVVFINVPISEGVEDGNSACSREFECGSIQGVGYPFWGNSRPANCGLAYMELTCSNDNTTTIQISSTTYKVLGIKTSAQAMTIARMDYTGDICTWDQLSSTTLDLEHFQYTSGDVNLTLLYGCSPSSIPSATATLSQIICGVPPRNLYYNFTRGGVGSDQINGCQTSLVVPVLATSEAGVAAGASAPAITTAINGGFQVQWTTDNGQKVKVGSTISLKRKLLIAFGCLAAGIIFTCLFFFIYRRHRYRKGGPFIPIKSKSISASTAPQSRSIPSINPSSKDLEKGSTYFGVHVFTYEELQDATDNFNSNKELGDGGFGSVYHGKLRDGREVAVKRLYENNYRRVEQFMNEVEILTRLRHQNLVTLYGCTSRHSRELLLVYEFIANGTVADNLHGDRAEAASLTWPIRMRIAIETASALSYLHASDVIHRDVKTTNILLDNNFGVKVADFGLSRLFPTDVTHVSTAPQGTPGYVDPEYHQFYQLTDKSDVYSFGVVLIELISSKAAVDVNRNHREINLANMAINKIQNQALHELVDPSLGFGSDYAVKMMITSVAELAFRCLQLEKEMRPSMDEVLETLKGIEKENYKVEKAALVIRTDKLGLLKNINPPFSPDSVTDKWVSRSTTPNTSA